MRLLLLFLLSTQAFAGGLDRYVQLVVSNSHVTPRNGVRVTYLGTNGYRFEFKGCALFVDPYFSRVDLKRCIGSRIQPNLARINGGLRHLASNPEAILVTHGHFDHLLDVPSIMAKTHAHLIASASSVELASAGESSGDAVKPGDVRQSRIAHARPDQDCCQTSARHRRGARSIK